MNFDYNLSLFERELRHAITTRKSEIIEQLAKGSFSTLEDARRLNGFIAAFDEALIMMETVRDQIHRKEGER